MSPALPLQQPWLRKLQETLVRLGLPLRAIATRDRSLLLWLRRDDAEPLLVRAAPVSLDAPCWKNTARFSISWSGAAALDASSSRSLLLFEALLRRVEMHLPATFDLTEGAFGDDVPPEERFLSLFPFAAVEHSTVGSAPVTEILLRTTRRCNQACPFCSAPDRTDCDPAVVRDAILSAGGLFPGATLTMTGGEPTLRPSFPAELALALDQPALHQIQIQTNAVAFARDLDPAAWQASPRLAFFVSLHAVDAAIYDACTGTRGQLDTALRGIRRLIAAEHAVTLNTVVSSLNLAHLPALTEALPALIDGSRRVDLHFSSLICHEGSPDAPRFLVRYTELAPALEHAAALAAERGVLVQSLRSSTHASVPPCVLHPSLRSRDPHRATASPEETGFEDPSRPWTKAASCRQCVESPWCLGVPAPYARRFGLSELTPIAEGECCTS